MADAIEEWKGEFGDEYTTRNSSSEENLSARAALLLKIITEMNHAPKSIVEVGAGGGANLRALRRVLGRNVNLTAVEPNGAARARLIINHTSDISSITDSVVSYTGEINNVRDGSASRIPLHDASADFVFTSGVLIHIAPEDLGEAMDEIHRVSGRWIAAIEYFNPELISIPYRGRDGLLWKGDYGSLYLDRFPDLHCVAYGFEWKRETALDNVTWWLLEKKP